MKIVHVVQNYFPSKGGTQTLFKEVSERLVKNYGDEVIVCTTDSFYGPEKKIFKEVIPKEENINGVTVKRFRFYRFHQKALRFASKAIAKSGFKVPSLFQTYLHGPWSPSMTSFLNSTDASVICGSSYAYEFMNYPLKRDSSKPFVFMGAIHFNDSNIEINRTTIRAIQKSKFYIANTEFEKQELIKQGIKSCTIKVIGCGVDVTSFVSITSETDFRKKYKIKDGPIVGYLGRHEPSKGIDVLIDAMDVLWKKNKNYQLIIAGSESDFTRKVVEKIKNLHPSYQSNVTLISDFSEEEKVAIYNHLDVFASVSTSESFGIVYLEAWACRKPVIGANIGAVRSVITNNADGYLITPGNVFELAERIEELCTNKKLREELGNNGYKKILENYTWDLVASRFRSVYEEAIGVAEEVDSK